MDLDPFVCDNVDIDSDDDPVSYIMSEINERTRLVADDLSLAATMPQSQTFDANQPDEMNSQSPRRVTNTTTNSVTVINNETKGTKMPCFLLTLTVCASIGGFLFGYDTGVVSGAMRLLITEFHLSSFWQEIIVSVTIGAACLSALLGGILNERLGRKPTIMIGSVVFTAGAVVLGISQNKETLLVGRIIVGLGIGLASTTVPLYIVECAPSEMRGRLVTMNNLFITGGQFIASVLDGAFSYDRHDGWRYMLGIAGIPSVIQFVCFFFLPESPRWLVKNGKIDKAGEVLKRLRGSSDIENELSAIIKTTHDGEDKEKKESMVIVRILRTPSVRRALFLGCGLQFYQQLSGVNTVMYYSATIIKMAGIKSETDAIWLASLTASINFVFTIIGVWLVERIGRRPLIIMSLIGVFLSLVISAIGFQLMAAHSPPVTVKDGNFSCLPYSFCESCIGDSSCGYCYNDFGQGAVNGSCLKTSPSNFSASVGGRCDAVGLDGELVWAYDYCPTSYAWLVILGLGAYLMFFAPGMGPMPWTINSEIYPLWARGTANSLATATNWITNLLVSMTFLTLINMITKYGTYWMFTGIAFSGIIFLYIFLPETKGKSLEEVEQLFNKPRCTCCSSMQGGLDVK